MLCPACKTETSLAAGQCQHCDTPIRTDDFETILVDAQTEKTVVDAQTAMGAPTAWAEPVSEVSVRGGKLTPGALLGGRYEIVKMLGEGGMGAVYKARDREVDRMVALKVIRPELASHSEILDRFKRELILTRQITHKNVIRIFDLGQADGIKFITMEFVEGRDLRSLTNEAAQWTSEKKVRVIVQICRALDAAHAEGVVHRDLKPQNIMVEENGRVVVMDFGIAHSMLDAGLTSTGTLIGTPAYMSPEQAKGENIDPRSDLFALGIVFYELLTGTMPYQADTAMGLLLKRIQELPVPPVERNSEIPQALSDIVLKALTIDRQNRYQSAQEIVADLEGWSGSPTTFRTVTGARTIDSRLGTAPDGRVIVTPPMAMMEKSSVWKWIAISVAAVGLVGAGVVATLKYTSKPAGPHAPMTVMIADINNHTGDPVFSGTLESTLKLAMEGASFISAYDRTRMRDLGLPAITGPLDESKAQGVAVSQGLNVVVSGAVDKRGAEYQLSLRAIEAVTGKVIKSVDETASGKDQVLFAVSKLATSIRKSLGDSTSESAQRFSMETLTAGSLEAIHEYAVALDALSSGKNDEAQKHFSQAVVLDPNFGLAYAGMASASHNLGRQQDAEKYIKEAITHIDKMTERERFRTRAFLYLLIGDAQKCVDEYGALLEKYLSDTGAFNNMAVCSTQLRDMPKALEEVRRAVAILPKRATYHVNLSFYSSYGNDFTTAAKEATAVLQLNPNYPSGFLAMAFAELGQEQLAQAAESYGKLQNLRASDGVLGLADLALYEGRYADAVAMLQKGAAADETARNPDAAADKYARLAYTELTRRQNRPALEAANSALDLSKAVKTRFVAAQIFAAAGETAKAQKLAAELSAELQIEPQAYGKLIEGEIALKGGDGRQAVKLFKEANSLLDTWMGRFDLGRAYLEIGAFTEADSEFDRCLKRRGETLALFLDETPSYGYFPPVYYYQGRVREGMKSQGFAESYRKYLSIRGKAGEDPLLAEIRRRAG